MRGITALAIIAAVLAGILLLGSGSGGPPSTAASRPGSSKPQAAHKFNPTQVNPGIEIQAPVKHVVECEKPTVLENQGPGKTRVMKMGRASMGAAIGYLEIPDGWIKSCSLDGVAKKGGVLPGKAIYEVELPREDDYYVFIRAKWYDSCGNSVWFRCNRLDYINVQDKIGEVSGQNFKWAWHPVVAMGEPKVFHLKAGKNRLELNTREDGPMFDKILVSTDATPPAANVVNP